MVLLLLCLHEWASHTPGFASVREVASSLEQDARAVSSAETQNRQALLEVLDRMVLHEKYYRSIYGRFTKVLSRIDYVIPHSVATQYEIRILEADDNKLLISAFSEEDGKTVDTVSIDQAFHVEGNFPIPRARADYLKVQAYKQMRLMLEAPDGQFATEEGVFIQYFHYEIRHDSKDRAVAFAMGVKPPVLGIQLQADRGDPLMTEDSQTSLRRLTELANESSELEDGLTNGLIEEELGRGVGQSSDGVTTASPEEAMRAKKAARDEMGRYARDWAELWKITRFPIEEKQPDRKTAGFRTHRDGLVIEQLEP